MNSPEEAPNPEANGKKKGTQQQSLAANCWVPQLPERSNAMVAQLIPTRQNAMERALARAFADGNVATYSLAGKWLVSSTSRPGTWHTVDAERQTCDCEAGQRGLVCKHLALVEHFRNEPRQQCGHRGDSVRELVRVTDEHVRWVIQCRNTYKCSRRQAPLRAAGVLLRAVR